MQDNFENAFRHYLLNEGTYSKHALDPGGETYQGISKYWFPQWEGWETVDQYRHNFSSIPTSKRYELDAQVSEFYRITFWDRIHGDIIAGIDAPISVKLFDTAAHRSVETAIETLQEGLNLLNLNNRIYPDLTVDGKIGPITIGTLKRYLKTQPYNVSQTRTRLLKVWSIIQGHHALQKMRENPEKEIFRGWIDRA